MKTISRISKIYSLSLLVSGLFIFSTSSYAAQEEKFDSTLALGGEVHYYSLTNSKMEGLEIGFDSTTALTAKLDYRPLRDWAVKVGLTSFETDMEVGIDERFEHYGSFKQTTISATLLYMSETSKKSPYKMFIGGGLSYHFNDIEKDNQSAYISDFFAKNRTISKVENSLGIHGTIGFKYVLSDHLRIGALLSLSATEAKADVTYPDSSVRESDLSLNAISIGTGLEYQF